MTIKDQRVGELLFELRQQMKLERQQEIRRALSLKGVNPQQSAYHLGLADGRNGVAKAVDTIMNKLSITMRENGNGDQRSV